MLGHWRSGRATVATHTAASGDPRGSRERHMPDAASQPKTLYRRSPLLEVIVQLCFPPILRIEAEKPAAFQDLVRSDFPYFETKPAEKQKAKSNQAGAFVIG